MGIIIKGALCPFFVSSILLFGGINIFLRGQQGADATLGLQKIGPLFCFGQNIIPQGSIVVRAIPFYYHNQTSRLAFLAQQALYAPFKNFVLFLDLPVILSNRGFPDVKGLANVRLQAEYAYYKTNDEHTGIECTVLGNVIIPTPAVRTFTPINPGAISTFWGTTASYLSRWYAYASLGCRFNSAYKEVRFGNQLFYEACIGHLLPHIGPFQTYLLVECNGIYINQSKLYGKPNPNSGANIVYIGPTLCLTGKNVSIFTGIQGILSQQFKGIQDPRKWRFALMAAIKF